MFLKKMRERRKPLWIAKKCLQKQGDFGNLTEFAISVALSV
jgi:hypothetical protein